MKYYSTLKWLFSFEICHNAIYFSEFWNELNFLHHYSSLQCHMILQRIWCSRKISYNYHCWKQLRCLIFLWNMWCIFMILWQIECLKKQHLFEIFFISVIHPCWIKVLVTLKKEQVSWPKVDLERRGDILSHTHTQNRKLCQIMF